MGRWYPKGYLLIKAEFSSVPFNQTMKQQVRKKIQILKVIFALLCDVTFLMFLFQQRFFSKLKIPTMMIERAFISPILLGHEIDLMSKHVQNNLPIGLR